MPGLPSTAARRYAVAQTERDGTFAGSEHYATRLEGDVSQMLATIAAGWLAAAASTQHVVSHATVSIGSPTTSAPANGGDDQEVTSWPRLRSNAGAGPCATSSWWWSSGWSSGSCTGSWCSCGRRCEWPWGPLSDLAQNVLITSVAILTP